MGFPDIGLGEEARVMAGLKKVWRKPEIKTLRAGAAETGPQDIVSDGAQANQFS